MLNKKLLSIKSWGLDVETFVGDVAHKMNYNDLVENTLAIARQLTDEISFTQSSEYPNHKGYNKGSAVYVSDLYAIKSWVLRGLLQESKERGMRIVGDADDKFLDIVPSDNKEELIRIYDEYSDRLANPEGSIKPDASKGYTHLVIVSYSVVRYMKMSDYRDYVIFSRTRDKLLHLGNKRVFSLSSYKNSLPNDIKSLKELRKKLSTQAKGMPRSDTRVSPYDYCITKSTPHGKVTFYLDAKCMEVQKKLLAIRLKIEELQSGDKMSSSKIRLNVERYMPNQFIFNFARLNGYTYGAVKVPYQVLANYCSQVMSKSNSIVFNICNEFLKSIMLELSDKKISTKTGISLSRVTRHFLYAKDKYILNKCESNGIRCDALHKLDSDYYVNKASKLLREYRNWLDNIERGCE